MASKESHIERTANEPRDPTLHTVVISQITPVTPTIRLFRLEILANDSITFLPGQWVDLYAPAHTGILKPGGFTITSSPTLALPSPSPSSSPDQRAPYLELAIQSSPLTKPVAAYLFQPPARLLHTPVAVRMGGSFVFPPRPDLGILLPRYLYSHSLTLAVPSPPLPPPSSSSSAVLRKVVLVAGGMGVNPLVSMLSWIGEMQGAAEAADSCEMEVRVLYSVRDPDAAGAGPDSDAHAVCADGPRDGRRILFLERIVRLFERGRVRGGLRLFLTAGGTLRGGGGSYADSGEKRDGGVVSCAGGVGVPFLRRRMAVRDVEEAVGRDKEAAVVYICGVPTMTDEFVQALVSPEGFGMDKRRVLCEKW